MGNFSSLCRNFSLFVMIIFQHHFPLPAQYFLPHSLLPLCFWVFVSSCVSPCIHLPAALFLHFVCCSKEYFCVANLTQVISCEWWHIKLYWGSWMLPPKWYPVFSFTDHQTNTGTPEHNTHGAKHYAHTGTPIRLTKTGKPERQYCFIAHVQLAFFWLRGLWGLFIDVDLLSSKMEEIGKKTVEELGPFFP